MSNKLTTLEDFMKKYIENRAATSGAMTYDAYKYGQGANYDRDYAKAVESLYAKTSKTSAGYGQNYQALSNKGLQNSGYSEYIDELSDRSFSKGLTALKGERDLEEAKTIKGYSDYLERYAKEQNALKSAVSSHLISTGVVNLDEAVAYGLSLGLSREDAIAIGQSVYSANKQKVFNDIIAQVATLGLDRDGAIALAKRMGVTDGDAEAFGDEVEDMLKHYSSVSEGYLEYLSQRSQKNTKTFN